ncbi:MAG: DUF5389 family protein [Pasteurellaceae bacterium]|nr:DUF5389 family protein [Pasteurellaceae bacterium]
MQGFSKFSWALGVFCLPSTLWPLALLVSPKFTDSLNLTPFQIDLFSVAFWVYPFVLLTISGILFKLHKSKPTLAKGLLALGFVAFYACFFYIVRSV